MTDTRKQVNNQMGSSHDVLTLGCHEAVHFVILNSLHYLTENILFSLYFLLLIDNQFDLKF